jgi:ABC-type uncharacterized transport system permease subunit
MPEKGSIRQHIWRSQKIMVTVASTLIGVLMAFMLKASFPEWTIYQSIVFGIYTGANVAQKFSKPYMDNVSNHHPEMT